MTCSSDSGSRSRTGAENDAGDGGAAAGFDAAFGIGSAFLASDFAGAGAGKTSIGESLTGLGVVRYHRIHPHSRLDRWLLSASVTPAVGNGGVGMFVSIATH